MPTAEERNAAPKQHSALHDLRVIDASTVLAGQSCARYLADFGADVIEVERPGSGDGTRDMFRRDPRMASPTSGSWSIEANGQSFVGGSPLVPVGAGEISCRFLGTKVEAFDDDGHSAVNEQAELVITEPMPPMPIGFWGDPDGSRLRAAYIERFPGVWCHGDWITVTERGTATISGRSDARLNRGGVRMATQEFYAAVEEISAIGDCLVVHIEDPKVGSGSCSCSSPAPGALLDSGLRDSIRTKLRSQLSPRHIPDDIIEVPVVPRTITGKRLEIPVKRIRSGVPIGPEVRTPLAISDALDPFVALAASGRGSVGGSGIR